MFYLLLFAGLCTALRVDITPKRIILLEGRPLEVKCRVNAPIAYCRFAVPGVREALSLRSNLPPHQGIEYVGAGLDKVRSFYLVNACSELPISNHYQPQHRKHILNRHVHCVSDVFL